MKKILLLLVVIGFVCTLSTAHAALLGMKDFIENAPFPGIVPDIQYDHGGVAYYSGTGKYLDVQAWDYNIAFSKPGPGTDLGQKVNFELFAQFSNKNFQWGYMIEYVNTDFSFAVGNTTYNFYADDLFLGAYLTAVGWDQVNKNQFDYITQNVIYGDLVDYGLWPQNYPIGGYIDTARWGTWVPWGDTDLRVITEKGDKVPVVPEPATMLLLGSGLLGMGVYARRRFLK